MGEADLILVGGGLASGLIARCIKYLRPELRVVVVEAGAQLGGNHTWSFHTSDVQQEDWAWLKGLISASWQGHRVLFPKYRRELAGGYHSISSAQFHSALSAEQPQVFHTGCAVKRISPHQVELHNGAIWRAGLVLDARGEPELVSGQCAFQKFLGLELECEPHGLAQPILMDATVAQEDGFRFFYVLPLTPTRLLIEDTHYSEYPKVEVDPYRREIHAYAAIQGWKVIQVCREERGALALPLSQHWCEGVTPFSVGVRGGFFHPTTGYSVGEAVRVARALARVFPWHSEAVLCALRELRQKRAFSYAFFRLLNRWMFQAAPPKERYRILEQFYRLPEGVISRFYSGTLGVSDGARFFCVPPPVRLSAAFGALWPKSLAQGEG